VTASSPHRPRPRLPHDRRVLLLALSAGLPGVITSLVLLASGDYALRTVWTFGGLVAGVWLIVALVLRQRVVRPLQTLSNMLAALREGDFSLRAREGDLDDALGLALLEINMLGDTLRSQRLGALEATSLLRAVMSEIDVAIFAFDEAGILRLSNRAGARLLGQPAERLAGRTADSLGLGSLLDGATLRVIDRAFPERGGRWEVRRTTFRQDGLPHQLLVVTDVTKSLREEELQAWQRLVRVLSHEINNSLAPIKSLAGSLRDVTDRAMSGSGDAADVNRGLGIIATRAESLSRFMSAYARLARLPPPRLAPVDVSSLVRRVAELDTRCRVLVRESPDLTINADRDQLEQALINLVRNAVDAAITTGGSVAVQWSVESDFLEIDVIDSGPGLSGSANLFVPFYTTKPDGSGIGLVLSRQIAEAHGGWLSLDNRSDGCTGALARLRLPLEQAP
jgi:two-component system, NtrC family, nitrogen regulation sensor histidine kinase NtrY